MSLTVMHNKSKMTPGLLSFAMMAIGCFIALTDTAVSDDQTEKPQKNARVSSAPVNWHERRLAGFHVVQGQVVDRSGQPVKGVEVGGHWHETEGDLSPNSFVVTDDQGQFELPLMPNNAMELIMAMDRSRKNGGLIFVQNQGNGSPSPFGPVPKTEVFEVKIELTPLADVTGSYLTTEVKRRPRKVWTTVEKLPEGIQVIEQGQDSPFFSFRLPPGKYRLRGNANRFEDVYREFEINPSAEPQQFLDLPIAADKMALLLGQPAPEFHFTSGKGVGKSTKLADYRGKWVVIEVWGAWCGPCIFEMEQNFMFSDRHAEDRGRFEILTLHHDLPEQEKTDLKAEMPRLLKRWKRDEFPYPIGFDDDNQMVKDYGITRFPSTIFIDPEGRVAAVNGIWGLSEILNGRPNDQPSLFKAEEFDPAQRPDPIRPSSEESGITGTQFIAFNGHRDMVAAVGFLPDGNQFVTAGSDNTLRFWDVDTCQQARMITCTPKGNTISSYGGIQLFMTAGLIGGHYYEKRDGAYVHTPRFWTAESDFQDFYSVIDTGVHFGKGAIAPNGDRFAAYTYSSELKLESARIYDLPRGAMLHELDIHGERKRESASGSALTFSPDSRHLAIGGNKGHSIQVWDVEQGKKTWERQITNAFGINSISFSPDGQTLTYATWSGGLDIFKTESGELVRTLNVAGHRPMCVAFSSKGRWLASAGTHPSSKIKIWDLRTGKVAGTLSGHPTGARTEAMAWSPDDTQLVSVSGITTGQPGEVLLWDLVKNGIVPAP